MRTNLKNIGLAVVATLAFASCSNDNETTTTNEVDRPSTGEWYALRNEALGGITQNFTLTAENGMSTLTSDKGVQISINGACLTKNGNPVTGVVDIKYIEVFDGGTMLVTDKTTMGQQPDGSMGLIISGGEFFIEAKQGGVALDITCPMQLIIPANLTGGIQNDMLLWNGNIDEDGNLDWKRQDQNPAGQGGVFGEGTGANAAYYAALNDFGWTNVDKFYSDPRPRTTILASAPTGYDFENSAIYLHYDGEGNALAKLDTFDSVTQQFSEHYGQIPIGLACHVIFVTEDNGNYRYAIMPKTIAANDVYSFTLAQTTVGTEAQLKAAINALP
jgi:hypothetical protein